MRTSATVTGWLLAIAAATLVPAGPVRAGDGKASEKPAKAAAKDTGRKAGQPEAKAAAESKDGDDMSMKGGEEGTVFKSLTVTGEDRIRIDFQRPELRLDLDARSAPGLEWGNPMDVLAEPGVDLVTPLPALSSETTSPFLPRPWIDRFEADEVVKFHPSMEGVERWRLIVADSRSDTVATFEGKGNPDDEIAWNGLSRSGKPVPPGVTCSYVLEATDRAGNSRSFVGEGFKLPPYRVESKEGETLLFPASELGAAAPASPILGEVVSRLNLHEPADAPIEIRVTASSATDAESLGKQLVAHLREHVLGDPARIRAVSDVRPDAPDGGTVAVFARS